MSERRFGEINGIEEIENVSTIADIHVGGKLLHRNMRRYAGRKWRVGKSHSPLTTRLGKYR